MKRVIPFLFLFAAAVLVVGIATRVIAQSSRDKIPSPWFQITQGPGTTVQAFQITQDGEMLVTVGMDGKVTFGPDYKPGEAAKIFWETLASYAPQAPAPKPEWVPDPSAGHYDCPDGWTAFSRSEPMPLFTGPVSAVFVTSPKDKKGHILGEQPPAPICVRDVK